LQTLHGLGVMRSAVLESNPHHQLEDGVSADARERAARPARSLSCIHRWRLSAQIAGMVSGKCLRCGADRTFNPYGSLREVFMKDNAAALGWFSRRRLGALRDLRAEVLG